MVPDPHDRLAVVLVRARNPSNIGAAARAMHDLGFRNLRIVNEFPVPFQAAMAANRAAVDASSVLKDALEFTSVSDAIADCALVYGTTAVGERVLEHPLEILPQGAPAIASALSSDARVALLFGSEKTGLSNDELSHCHRLLTIPMNSSAGGRHLSMNLGQAVAVCLYAISNADHVPHSSQPQRDPGWGGWDNSAAAADLERLTTLLRDILETSGYTRRHPANCREPVLRRMVRRMMLPASDAAVWTGIFRQIQHALAGRAVAPANKSAPIASDRESIS